MNNPGAEIPPPDQDWDGLSDEEILQRLEQLAAEPPAGSSADAAKLAREGLEILRQVSEERPLVRGDSKPLSDALGSQLANHPDLQRRLRSWLQPKSGMKLGDRYKLVERIGEGGMGSVWVGEQLQPVRRRVAIKLVKPGMDSRHVLDRFETERQALAAMDHPNIARILDGGLTDMQTPFFVMELVNGASLTKFCDDARLSIRERLELFTQISQGVQHAHQKGIIHRDLKPSNILVTVIDGRPFPKIIDFGLAKALGGRPADSSLATHFGAVVGTLEYMSPEQAGFSGQDIDTRADIYSLGVILYELLTGLRPFDARRLQDAALDEMLRIIKEEDPTRPSARLSSSNSAPSSAALRQTEPKSLTGLLRNELDWIVMKALEKDRIRRYETATGFAADIQRYLAGEPVLAHPPSNRYRLQKFVRRNRAGVVATSLVLLSLLAGLGTTLWQARIARREAARADDRAAAAEIAEQEQRRLAVSETEQRRESQKQRELADQAAEAEKTRAAELGQVASFQGKMLSEIDVTAAGKQLGDNLRQRLSTALTATPVETAQQQARLAAFAGELQLINLTDTSIDMIDQTVVRPAIKELEELKQDQPATDATLRTGLALVYRNIGRFPEAVKLQEESLETRRRLLGDDHRDTIEIINSLGLLYQESGQLARAQPLAKEALERNSRLRGADHRDTLIAQNNLGLLWQAMGKSDAAEQLFRTGVDRARIVLGQDDFDTIALIANLGLLKAQQRKYDEAEPLAREVLEKRRRLQGNEHRDTLMAINNLGFFLNEIGKTDECEQLLREGLEKSRRLLGEDNPQTINAIYNFGTLLFRSKKFAESEPLMREAVEKFARVLGPNHGNTLFATNSLANLLSAQDKLAEVETLRRDVLDRCRQALGPDHDQTLAAMNALAGLLEKQKRFADAEPIRTEYLERNRRLRGPDHNFTLSGTVSLATNLQGLEKFAEAEPYFREVLAISTRTKGAEHPNTAVARRLLGENLVGQLRYAEAETELLAAEQVLATHAESTPDRHQPAVESMVKLYEIWDKAAPDAGYLEKAVPWREKLERLQGGEN